LSSRFAGASAGWAGAAPASDVLRKPACVANLSQVVTISLLKTSGALLLETLPEVLDLDLDADLEPIIRDLAPRVLRYAVARTGEVCAGEDVAQESLAALVRRWRRSGPPESAEAFVFSIARRRAMRVAIRRRLWVPIERAFTSRDAAPDPERQAVARDEQDRVRAGLARLPRHEREALMLVALGEASVAQAAAVLRVSVSAVKMRIHRARRRLAEDLAAGPFQRSL
jgi:RNA polymerase sigma-70 factor (ECF subfamily)